MVGWDFLFRKWMLGWDLDGIEEWDSFFFFFPHSKGNLKGKKGREKIQPAVDIDVETETASEDAMRKRLR